MSSTNQPNTTLYINNLNDKVNKEELKIQLLALFATYGLLIDIIASKSQKMRGQAFLVFSDLASATSAMRACEGMMFYDKPLHIAYAKSKSYATLRSEDPNFVPPTAANASGLLSQNGKRLRDGETGEDRPVKKGKEDDSDEEMEIDDEEETPQNKAAVDTTAPTSVPSQVHQPTARLLCQNLPQEVTDDVLSVLFQQYKGFQRAHVSWSPNLNPQGMRVKMAQVTFESPELSATARDALDNFTLKKGWQMSVAFI
ncbi:hypothetical protein CPB83DRAFT_843082 [Crepidotus variabilis]|uniref:RRM domain-containing protein n=1 Tax=Crepidotus variabilis TaxID=179855 RepID=A0A9P6JWP7_9AGAR|nr:hypothetical protein CPB83DRAFT_843082 [Crepidotus variabilis]